MQRDLDLVHEDVLALARPEVRAMPLYDPGFSDAAVRSRHGLSRIVKLSNNESPMGASPAVATALAALVEGVGRYPDPACLRLRAALAEQTGVRTEQICIGNGSENLLELVCQAFLSTGERVVVPTPCFGLHEIYPRMMGAVVHKVALREDFEFDLPAWRAALAQPAKLVMFSNPSNPVGCVLDQEGFRQLIEAAPLDALLVVDEAYYEYAGAHRGFPDSLRELRLQARPWLVLRTFSKAWGLAGLRVGYGLASDAGIVAMLDRVRTPYNVNHAAQEAALAALCDPSHMYAGVAFVRTQRERLARQLREHGFRVAPSHANFLFVDVGRNAVDVAAGLLPHGVIVKPWRESGYESFIRVSIGQADENDSFFAALMQVCSGPAA